MTFYTVMYHLADIDQIFEKRRNAHSIAKFPSSNFGFLKVGRLFNSKYKDFQLTHMNKYRLLFSLKTIHSYCRPALIKLYW